MKKTALTLILISALLVSTIAGAKLINLAEANPYPYTNCDSSFVTVSILSPENKTCDTNSILVTISAGAYPGVWGVSYSVDGGFSTGIESENYLGHGFRESVWVNRLSKGSHNIMARAITPSSENMLAATFQVYFTLTSFLEPVLQIMSFEEAVQAANASSKNESRIIDNYVIYGNVESGLYNESGVSGYLMWLSPDGALYAVGFPDGNTLWLAPNGLLYVAGFPDGNGKGRIGNTAGQSGWNPPDGYYIWNLDYGMEEDYWVLANNGTILLYNPPRVGPTSPPTQSSIPYELIYGIALPIFGIAICLSLLVYFKKRKH